MALAPVDRGGAVQEWVVRAPRRTATRVVRERAALVRARALVGESDHGASKSLYARDPDGTEFEVMWMVPRDDWPEGAPTRPLEWDVELPRWRGVPTG